MLYKKNTQPDLTHELFKNPTSEYRGAPFWAWNCRLDARELKRQIEIFKKMGLGGFHMHVRTGLATPYLSEEFMEIVKACVDKAKAENMLAWLYDEDRWPSGAAGGFVTEDERFRARYLLFTHTPYREKETVYEINDSRSSGGRNGNGRLLAVYDVELDGEGCLKAYRTIDKNTPAKGEKWYAYLEINQPASWFNNQTYVDTLNKAAIERFTEVTHDRYTEYIGEDFGETVPAIFTDEPQFSSKHVFDRSFDTDDITMPWTDDIPREYAEKYGEDILASLPELFWELPHGRVSVSRYFYHDLIAERFAAAFGDTCGKWCSKNGIALTGHMMEEPTLRSQSAAVGEAMRAYRGFHIPGIDMLTDSFEFTTAKQAQSAAHQYGREGVMSELYGVTGWDFDFRGHKLYGDWQAALGVTVRVPHLSWVSMKGEAKRDYPASISYQSPWWEEYSYVENHFARVNTALTRGKPIVKTAVIHPIESYWLHWGANDKTSLYREGLDEKFLNLTQWLLKGSVDFDFISEALLPDLCPCGGNPLKVGEMEYDSIIVPDCETLRASTLERLEAFREGGGKLIFMGEKPKYENAKPSRRGERLFDKSMHISFDRAGILASLEDSRTLTLKKSNGALSDKFIYQLRSDNGCDWLFVAHCGQPYNKDVFSYEDLRIHLKGEKKVTVYDTVKGDTYPAHTEYSGGKTIVKKRMYDFDSLLLKIEDGKNQPTVNTPTAAAQKALTLPREVDYTLDEKNVLLLDQCEFKVDDGEYQPLEEILRADNKAREIVGMGHRNGAVAQPWVVPYQEPKHTVTLKFAIQSEIDYRGAELALEDADKAEIFFNGNKIENKITGWYVDKSIETVSLPKINKGENILTVKLPLGSHTNTEWMYLLGDFGVRVRGRSAVITALPEKVYFGDIVPQGFPFYGGNITYRFSVGTPEGSMKIVIPSYRGGLTKVYVDGEDKGNIVYSPNTLELHDLTPGEHTVEIKLFTNRYNSFGAIHNSDEKFSWKGPDSWRTRNERWSYEYWLSRVGLLSAPMLFV